MKYPNILGIGTSLPSNRYNQMEIFEHFLAPHFGRNRRARAIFANAGVQYRHTAIQGSFYDRNRTTEERNDQYVEHAVPLGAAAIRRCLDETKLTAQDVDDLFIVSCTGLDTPGLDLLLAGELGMRPDLTRASILAMGCYGAFPGLLRARDAVTARPNRIALLLAIELCSLHLQFDNTLENIVASALFSDGAAAVLVASQDHPLKANEHMRTVPCYPALIDAATFCDYRTFDHMAFHVTDHGFRMRLSAYVPDVLAANVPDLVSRLLGPHDLKAPDIRFWAVHPGSSKILDYVQSSLGLEEHALDPSRRVLENYGNMSSATVLFVLDEIVTSARPRPGDYGVLMAFGPGLTLECALVRW